MLGDHRPGVSQAQLVAFGVAEVRRRQVADQKAAVGAVEDVLHQLQQAHGDLGFAGPRGRKPLVHGALHATGHPGHQRPGERQPIEGAVGDPLRHVQIPAVAEKSRSVSTVLEQQAQQHLGIQSSTLK